ncbi:NUDIX domain-containing protein [Actinomadura spongiicola]
MVLSDTDQVLLLRYDEGAGVFWAIPGGGLKPGETRVQAVLRELAADPPGRPWGSSSWHRHRRHHDHQVDATRAGVGPGGIVGGGRAVRWCFGSGGRRGRHGRSSCGASLG